LPVLKSSPMTLSRCPRSPWNGGLEQIERNLPNHPRMICLRDYPDLDWLPHPLDPWAGISQFLQKFERIFSHVVERRFESFEHVYDLPASTTTPPNRNLVPKGDYLQY
jgi:hypothetical protein